MHKGATCELRPWEMWHLRVDGTTQLRYMGVPQFAELGKSDGTKRMGVKLMIVDVPGHAPFIYSALDNIAGDSNFTIDAIQRTLQALEKEHGYLPEVLSFQFDNCGDHLLNNV